MAAEQIELKSFSKKLGDLGTSSSIVSVVFIEYSPEVIEQAVKDLESAGKEC